MTRKRPLTERGISRFKEAVGGLKGLDATIDEIFTSPLVRARQTADLLAAGVDGRPTVKLLDALAPGHSAGDRDGAARQGRQALGASRSSATSPISASSPRT